MLAACLSGCSGDGDGDGGDDACRKVDVAFPSFTPETAKDGESVKIAFTIEAGTPTTACLAEVRLDCGGQKTSYIVGGNQAGEISANLVLHCDQAAAPVGCSYSYEYPRGPGANQGGVGTGPTCAP